jgi:CcmD family protein
MADLTFLYAAYTIVWAGVFVYMLWLHFDQLKLRKDLELLEEVLHGEPE